MVDELEIGRPPHETRRAADQQPDQQVRPPPERGGGVSCVTWSHGAMISISLGGGIAIWSFVLATRSTNACVDHALCSSCNCPHSICRWSRCVLSLSSSTNNWRARCLQ